MSLIYRTLYLSALEITPPSAAAKATDVNINTVVM
jgi:hypothetical protein